MKLIKKWVNKNSYILLMMLSFILLDFIMRFFTRSINFYNIFGIVPNLFTLMWVFLMVGICISLNKKVGRILYIILVAIGSFLPLTLIFIIADIVNGLMAIPNLVGIIGLRKVVIEETEEFFRGKALSEESAELEGTVLN